MPRRKQPHIPDELLDQLLAGSDARAALADGGLLDGLKKALAERALNAELDHHLEGGEPDGRANSRNGYGSKTVLTGTGRLDLQVPRGHRQVVGARPTELTGRAPARGWSSGRGGDLADVRPYLEPTRPCGSMFTGGDVVAAEMKEIGDLIVGGEEALYMPR